MPSSTLEFPDNAAIMPRLKSETRQQHEMLEDTVNVLDSTATSDGYRSHLLRTAGYVLPLERALKAGVLTGLGLDLENRWRSSLIEEDLRQLDLEVSREEMNMWPELKDEAHAVGTFYVVEGSTLGGMIIAQHLRQRLGIDSTTGGSFYHARGKQTMAMWRTFGAAANAFVERSGRGEQVIEGARRTFEELTGWFRA